MTEHSKYAPVNELLSLIYDFIAVNNVFFFLTYSYFNIPCKFHLRFSVHSCYILDFRSKVTCLQASLHMRDDRETN